MVLYYTVVFFIDEIKINHTWPFTESLLVCAMQNSKSKLVQGLALYIVLLQVSNQYNTISKKITR